MTLISGQGGTGKTSLAAALADLASREGGAVIGDLDADAPDLHLLLNPSMEHVEEFVSGYEAVVDPELCTDCGDCETRCRFGARAGGPRCVDLLRCEGCGACAEICPVGAVQMVQRHLGRWYRSATRFGPLVHAHLFPGQENSSRLVSRLREEARRLAEAQGLAWQLNDGASGLGCPVISSIEGADLALIVTEPTPAGRRSLEQIAGLAERLEVPAALVVNRFDVNLETTHDLEVWAYEHGIRALGRLPHDPSFAETVSRRRVLTEHAERPITAALDRIWQGIQDTVGPLRAA